MGRFEEPEIPSLGMPGERGELHQGGKKRKMRE